MLRLPPERMAEALVSLVGAGLLVRDETGLSPENWPSRQYKSDSSAEKTKRYRDRRGDVTVTAQNRKDENRTDAVTVEVTDEQALAAWDAYGRATTGKPYPRNRRGGWCFPSPWPTIHTVAGGAA